jgi:CheY-like chemotaxis protein
MPVLLSGRVDDRQERGYPAETDVNAGIETPQGLISLVSIMRSLRGCVPVGLRDLQVLVIEDAPDMLDVLTMLLRIEGADVAGASSGHEALTVFSSRHFDVVVTDLGLPDISGDALIRKIIAAARRPLKVVVITGESQPALTRALEAGAEVIFAKPCQWARVVTYLDGLSLAQAA